MSIRDFGTPKPEEPHPSMTPPADQPPPTEPTRPTNEAPMAAPETPPITQATPPPQPPPMTWQAAPPTPAGPAAGLSYGGFWVRFVAYIIDLIIVGVVSFALSPLFGGNVVTTGPNGVAVNYGAQGIGALIGLVYFVGFWVWRGQTPGMIPFNLRVVRADNGGPVDLGRGILRYVGLIISIIVIFIGLIWVAFDSRKQGWHDKIAGTLVVRPT